MNPKPDLSHVLWIGGSACAGKTSIVRNLSERFGVSTYHCDEHFNDHRTRVEPERHPAFHHIMRRSPEELFSRAAQDQVTELVSFYAEELEMVVADLEALPAARPVLAEGAGLMPALLQTLEGVDAMLRRAVWLVAGARFRRRHYPSRGPWVARLLAECSDPQQAWHHWMERDDRFAAVVAEEARRLGGRVIHVDGRSTLDGTAEEVARHLRLETETS